MVVARDWFADEQMKEGCRCELHRRKDNRHEEAEVFGAG